MIRRLELADYEQYIPLLNQFRETTISQEVFQIFLETLPSNIEIWVYEENSQLIGTITMILEPKLIFNGCKFAHIEDVCVAESHRRHGIGTALLQHVTTRAELLGCRKLTLVCGDPVIPFYERNGFEVRGHQMSKLLFK